jgi:hypothetical protein
MNEVESYKSVTGDEITKSLQDDSFLPYQGVNILFLRGDYTNCDIKSFLEKVFHLVNKVAAQGKDEQYFILSVKFKTDASEPFRVCTDISEGLENDISSIATRILDTAHYTYELTS